LALCRIKNFKTIHHQFYVKGRATVFYIGTTHNKTGEEIIAYFPFVTNLVFDISAREEAGWNASTVAMRFVEGDEERTRRLGYNWANLSLGGGDRDTGT
jgi:hypothetical protein